MYIKFTEQENKILGLLHSVVKTKTPTTTIRVAGGWVRDKLLGLESHDIDIAIDNMSGENFAHLVKEYMADNNIINNKEITIIKANPDQSKHLATAMMSVFGLPIDFVNLRKETYSESRIPVIEPGTPEEDASRRDLTVNALFYNINKQKIEDFVGGLDDLKNKIAKTPIDPIQTWKDDPLRILRCIRFASKYNFELHPELYEASQNIEVQQCFKSKISKERIWREMAGYLTDQKEWKAGFLSGPNPKVAFQILKDMGFYHCLFETNLDSNHYSFVSKFFDAIEVDDYMGKIVLYLSVVLFNLELNHVEKILNNLNAPNDVSNRVLKTIKHSKNVLKNNSDKELRRFMRELDSDWRLAVNIVDFLNNSNLANKLEKLEQEIGGTKPINPLSGKELINMGWKPGPFMGKALKAIEEELLNNPFLTKEEAIELIAKFR